MLIQIFYAVQFIIVISIVLIIIAENRNPLKALPWLLVVVLLPIVGIILYIFFGEDLRHKLVVNKKIYSKINEAPFLLQHCSTQAPKLQVQHQPLLHLAYNTTSNAALPYSSIQCFVDGSQKFSSLLDDLNHAKHHIHIQYYAFCNDDIGNKIADILIKKRQEGVFVRLIYDDVGSWTTSKRLWKRMKKAGIELFPYMKVVFPYLSSNFNYRNHRKVVIIDGCIGYFGGMNVADRYYKGDELGRWRDTHFRIQGEATYLLQSAFLIDWNVVSRQMLELDSYYPQIIDDKTHEEPIMQLVPGGPLGQWRTIEQVFITAITRATKSINIETPYFLPTAPLMMAITTAALSGILVNIIIPYKSDSPWVQLAALSYVDELLEAGVNVFQYQKGFLHSKFITIDAEITITGSPNLDFRSLEHNFELAAILYDQHTTEEMNKFFSEDLRNSRQIIHSEWKKRRKSRKFIESLMRLSAPLF